ncbi:MAG: phage tail protein [Nitrospinota bacterium]|nr:phage tail protein [Nitrospinota bacterium]
MGFSINIPTPKITIPKVNIGNKIANAGIWAANQLTGAGIPTIEQSENAINRTMDGIGAELDRLTHLAKLAKASVYSDISKIPIPYGVTRAEGRVKYRNYSGTKDEYLHLCIEFGEGEVGGIDEIYFDEELAFNAAGTLQARFKDDASNPYAWVTKHYGTVPQTADAGLMAEFGTDYPSTRRFTGTAYIYLKLQYDQNIYTRVPHITANIRGRKVYDPRNGTTAYSANAALAINDYLQFPRGGKGLPSSMVNADYIKSAADVCDQQVEEFQGSGTTIAKFEANGLVDTSKTMFQNIQDLLTACRGWLPFIQGEYRLIIEKDEEPVFDFDSSNVMEGTLTVSGGSKEDMLNRVKVKFSNRITDSGTGAISWQPGLAVEDSSVFRADDNGVVLESEIEMPFEISPYRAHYRGETVLKRSRQPLAASFVASPEAIVCTPGDVVTYTKDSLGWEKKKFRIHKMMHPADSLGLVAVVLKEHEPTVYDHTVPVEITTPPDTTIHSMFSVPAPTGLTLLADNSVHQTGPDGTVIHRIKATWTAPADAFVVDYDFEYKVSGGAEDWTRTRIPKTTEHYIKGVKGEQNYDVRVRAVNSIGVVSPYVTKTNWPVNKKTTTPSAPSSLSAAAVFGGIRLKWINPTEIDFSYIKIYRHTSDSLSSATMIADVRGNVFIDKYANPGNTYYYWIVAINTSDSASAFHPALNGVTCVSDDIQKKIKSYNAGPVTIAYSAPGMLLNQIQLPAVPTKYEWQCKVKNTSTSAVNYNIVIETRSLIGGSWTYWAVKTYNFTVAALTEDHKYGYVNNRSPYMWNSYHNIKAYTTTVGATLELSEIFFEVWGEEIPF